MSEAVMRNNIQTSFQKVLKNDCKTFLLKSYRHLKKDVLEKFFRRACCLDNVSDEKKNVTT